jgi:predicted ATP-grasp superfamily ATP-dependent carboligase
VYSNGPTGLAVIGEPDIGLVGEVVGEFMSKLGYEEIGSGVEACA